MAVYVDDVRHKFGNMVMCHMWADTDEELLAMADTIGVARKWIQGHRVLSFGKHKSASWVHFDIALSKKVLAIASGAVLTDKYGPLLHTKKLMLAWAEANGNEEIAERCREWIARVEELREDKL